jgi:hypothetical protein
MSITVKSTGRLLGGPVNVGDRVLEVLDRLGSGAGQAELVVHEAGCADLVGHRAVAGGEALIEDPLHHGEGGGLAAAHDRRAGRGHNILPGGRARDRPRIIKSSST